MSRLLTAPPVPAVDPVAALRRLQGDSDDHPVRLAPGTRLFVEVIEPLAGGGVRARALSGGAEHRMPFNAGVGERLQVLVTGSEGATSYALLNIEAANDAPSISPAARLLAALAPDRGEAMRPPVLYGKSPLSARSGVDAPALARGLMQALSGSGLFYEAHQAQWVAGMRGREQLLDEPQVKLTLRDAPGSAERGALPLAMAADSARALDGVVHRETVPLVQQQLAALETGAIVWRGEIWRGQTAEWIVQREREQGEPAGRDAPAAPCPCRTRLRLTLPHLGAIDAAIAVGLNGIDMRIAAGNTEAGVGLEAAKPELLAALTEAELPVTRLEIRHVD